MSVPPKFKNPNLSMKSIRDYAWKKSGLPTVENTDRNDPKEMFLPFFTGMPGLNGAPLAFPTEYWMMISEHLWECGNSHYDHLVSLADETGHIHVSQLPKPIKKYRRPSGVEPNRFTAPGSWVPLDTPEPPAHPAKEAWERLSRQQQAELLEVIEKDDRLIPEQKAVLRDRLENG